MPDLYCQKTTILWLILIQALFLHETDGVAIDNGVIGNPDVMCDRTGVNVHVRTVNPFLGRIFVKLNPRGMAYSITVIVSFHPIFITKVDKAYKVNCFYGEVTRELTAQLEISMIPTTELSTGSDLPRCVYTVREGSPDGPIINYAQVGDKVYHRWECVSSGGGEMYGFLVKDCVVFAQEGSVNPVNVVDQQGCNVDNVLLENLTYNPRGTVAYAQSHVFKFADIPRTQFTCKIQVCLKSQGACNGITPPSCRASNQRPGAQIRPPVEGGFPGGFAGTGVPSSGGRPNSGIPGANEFGSFPRPRPRTEFGGGPRGGGEPGPRAGLFDRRRPVAANQWQAGRINVRQKDVVSKTHTHDANGFSKLKTFTNKQTCFIKRREKRSAHDEILGRGDAGEEEGWSADDFSLPTNEMDVEGHMIVFDLDEKPRETGNLCQSRSLRGGGGSSEGRAECVVGTLGFISVLCLMSILAFILAVVLCYITRQRVAGQVKFVR